MSISKKQWFHLEANHGLINDPNGLVYFKGKYYVFFQWNKFKKNHSYKEWGLYTSSNMIVWEFNGTALAPSEYFDINGIYSGSSCVINNQLYLFYTGNSKIESGRKSYQCLAVSDDGIQFDKKGPILYTPTGYTEHFRDPKVMKINDSLYYMLIGGQLINGKGAIALASSNNGRSWLFKHTLGYSYKYQMIECPDLFEINGRYIILYGMQNRDNKKDEDISSFSCYKVVDFDVKSGMMQDKNLDEQLRLMDYGFDFYAPQTFEDEEGRRILYGWMSRMDDNQEKCFSENESNIHCLTIPRELYVQDGDLHQRPVRELYQILGNHVLGMSNGNKNSFKPQSRSFYLYISHVAHQCVIKLYGHEIEMTYDEKSKEFVLCRFNWVTKQMEKKMCDIESIDNIEIWSDQSSLEIFINDGRFVLSSRVFPIGSDNTVEIKGLNNRHIIIKEINREKKYG